MSEVNLEVADAEFRSIVEGLKKNGLPPVIKIEDALPMLSREQNAILSQLNLLAAKEERISKGKKKPYIDDKWWRVREEIRKVIRIAIKNGMINLGIIQRQAVGYGAIPNPEEGWKYYVLPDCCYACWNCGADILMKDVFLSVHFEDMPFVGSGEVRRKQVPYCPNCEKEPSDHGIITESLADEIRRDSPWPQKS